MNRKELQPYMENDNTKSEKQTIYENAKLDTVEKILML